VPGNLSHGQGADLSGSVEMATPCAVAGAGLPAFLSHFTLGPPTRRRVAGRGCRPVAG
jgi:hypothetical protein